MLVREEGRSYALPMGPGKQMDEQAAFLMRTVRFTIDERQLVELDGNENEEDRHLPRRGSGMRPGHGACILSE
jgi:hypothetical protein